MYTFVRRPWPTTWRVTCLVRTYRSIDVIRSQKHWYETSGLGFIQTRCLCTDVWVDIWTFVWTHETYDNPPAKSLNRSSPGVSVNAFSHPLSHMTGLVVLETWMSVHQTLLSTSRIVRTQSKRSDPEWSLEKFVYLFLLMCNIIPGVVPNLQIQT